MSDLFDPDVDDWSHGPALLWRLHPVGSDPSWIDGVIGGPIPHCPDGGPVGLELRQCDERGDPRDAPAVVLSSRAEALEFLTLLSAAVDVCFPPASV